MAKTLPHHIESEQSILGIIFLNPKVIVDTIDRVSPDDFYELQHQILYQAMIDLFNENLKIDYASVSAKLDQNKQLEKVGGLDYIKALAESVPSIGHLDTYIELVVDRSLKRQVIKTTSQLMEEGYEMDDNATAYISKAEELIFSISQKRRTSAFIKISEVLKDVKAKVEFNQNRSGGITGLKTGFSNLDFQTTGLQPEELIILAARPSMGKSAFAINLAVNVAMHNKKGQAGVAIFSLEMSNEQLVSRIISSEASIENKKIRTGQLTNEQWHKFEAGIENLSSKNLYFDDSSSVTISDIRAKCRKLSQEGKLDFVVIDYLQLIHGDEKGSRAGNRQEEVSRISRGLKQMARELKVPVLALSQLSREVEKSEDKRPMLSHLRESGSIEQDADIVLFLYRDDYYKKEDSQKTGVVEVSIAKNRQGAAGVTLKYLFDTEHSRFKVLTERDE